MPVEVVDLDLTAETGAIPQPTFTDVGLVTTMYETPDDAEFGELNRYAEASDVADDYGENTDAHEASQAVQEMGASYWYVLALEANEETATLEAGTTTELHSGPILGTPEPEGDDEETIQFTTGLAESDNLDEEYDVVINTADGEAYADEEVELTFYYVNWSGLEGLGDDVNRVGVANRKFGVENIGTLDAVVSHASGNDMGMVAAGIDGRAVEDDDYALDVYHDTFGFVPSGDLLAVAHKSSDAVEGYILGQLAVNDPWFDPFYDGTGYPFSTEFYRDSLVGGAETPGTFEGGDEDDETGNVNVVISKAGTQVLSNSVTTAGSASDYQFFDIGRTQDFLAAEVQRELTSLRLRKDQIPFTKDGRAMIQNVISETLSQQVGGGGPLSDYSVTIPEVDDLTQSQRANREWAGINIDVTLAGNVHQFSVTLNLTV